LFLLIKGSLRKGFCTVGNVWASYQQAAIFLQKNDKLTLQPFDFLLFHNNFISQLGNFAFEALLLFVREGNIRRTNLRALIMW